MSEYPVIPFHEIAISNPRLKLQKDEVYPYISMGAVDPSGRFAFPDEKRVAGGGTKFVDGDILFARITPCLENGKIAQAKLSEADVGFGSTEFFVFRAKVESYDQTFLYYVCRSDGVRKSAEKSMVGASGRQRADITAVNDFEVPNPPLPIQKRIAGILSAYDDLIAVNERRIAILEETARRVFEEWFARSDLESAPLGKLISLKYGKALKAADRVLGSIPVYGSSGVVGCHNEALVNSEGLILGRKGNVGALHWCRVPFFPIDTVFYVESDLPNAVLFHIINRISFLTGDTAVPGLNREYALSVEVELPEERTLREIAAALEPFHELSGKFREKNTNLQTTRDLLLPRLVSGEINVSEAPLPETATAE